MINGEIEKKWCASEPPTRERLGSGWASIIAGREVHCLQSGDSLRSSLESLIVMKTPVIRMQPSKSSKRMLPTDKANPWGMHRRATEDPGISMVAIGL